MTEESGYGRYDRRDFGKELETSGSESFLLFFWLCRATSQKDILFDIKLGGLRFSLQLVFWRPCAVSVDVWALRRCRPSVVHWTRNLEDPKAIFR